MQATPCMGNRMSIRMRRSKFERTANWIATGTSQALYRKKKGSRMPHAVMKFCTAADATEYVTESLSGTKVGCPARYFAKSCVRLARGEAKGCALQKRRVTGKLCVDDAQIAA